MKNIFTKIVNFLTAVFTLCLIGAVIAAIGVSYILYKYGRDLPDYKKLAQYEPPTVTRLYAADGRMMEEYAKEKRLFVPVNAIPKRLINAFIAAEDQNFYSHPGIDFLSILRAAVKNASNVGTNKSLVGGSTITQQVVKNFLLTNEKSLDRKIKEAILAFRITKEFSKDKIMELYLNEIYLGNRSYGVAAAALNYFNKSIDELTIEEAAMLAALPKAPSDLDPSRFYDKAKTRRDWVIERMLAEGFITELEAVDAITEPINVVLRDETEMVRNADSFSEAVRQELTELYGEEGVYEKGLAVRTTLQPQMQSYAQDALRKGLLAYDKRHGYKGPVAKIKILENYAEELKQIAKPEKLDDWELAVVLGLDKEKAKIAIDEETKGIIPLKNLKWAKKYINDNSVGGDIEKPSDAVAVGDVVVVRKTVEKQSDETEYFLEQIPEVNGAIVAMDPYTGKVLAMVGGYGYGGSQFNRAIQAKRQPGSAFKPFVYLAALENGFVPTSIIVDEEVQLERGDNLPGWRPQNYSGQYYGPTTLRVGVEKSRNAMTVRLSQLMGIDKVVNVAKRFNIYDDPNRDLSVALGSAETTLMRLTNAYAMLVNGGKVINPSLIERIQNSNGKTIFKRDNRTCEDCFISLSEEEADSLSPPDVEEYRQQVADPIAAYQMVSILEGVVQRGTGRNLVSLEKILAGKTGTTNDSFDGWFMGFSANLAIGVYVGFDTPRSLGRNETGASVALPIWKEFARQALQNEPDLPFRRPSGVKLVKIDAKTGLLPSPDTPKDQIIFEAFRAGTEPDSATSNAFEQKLNGNGFNEDFGNGGIY
ncbi:MAG: penicillin-binding protein 1A [Rickettsiales bacterium]|nr:penicillin-binding protein 1A [Pseudomonadota bacterium]MDA0967047.1 penicillin-binding protein 1A [Pseudomonadota bacterium]MDG4542467.1 penicillin-binding protein 1A [Rickettsiales bacterium]MDG4544971.1 penicillin-binding protein 1A [Rickettsiales bacterium]MDG4547094.1 penicillin-binding protein 1A [Rickettsiales bacterium]